ncbi:MAG: hypothetical protein ACLGSH_04335 [Acidobacteriota bacterium]
MSQGCLECHHIFPGGRKCGAIALKGQTLCYAHANQQHLIEVNRARCHSVALPPLEDRAAIRMAIDEVLAALAASKITRCTASTYLYAIDLASRNLTRIEQLPPPAPHELCVESARLALPPQAAKTDAQAAPYGRRLPAGSANAAPLAAHPSAGPASAAPDSAAPQLDPQAQLPLTPSQIQERRADLEARLLQSRLAYAVFPEATADQPSPFRTYLQEAMDAYEAELKALQPPDTPDDRLPAPCSSGAPAS